MRLRFCEKHNGMRQITTHRGNPINNSLLLHALDERDPKNGNANHVYRMSWPEENTDKNFLDIVFQHGPVKENGFNGTTIEACAAVAIDRLEGFQSSEYACEENEEALYHFRKGLEALHRRTAKRIDRGVEGTNQI